MKLYVTCDNCKHKTYVNGVTVGTRVDFAQAIQSNNIKLLCVGCGTLETRSVNDVYAEGSGSAMGIFVLVLGLWASLVIGPVGLLLGGAIGAVVGAGWDAAEATQIRKFNTSVTS